MRWSIGRLALLGVGVALMGVGAVVGLTTIPQRQWPGVVLWLAGGVAVHDAILAPTAVLLGLLVLPRVGLRWRAPLRAGALGAAVLAVFAVVIVGASSRRRNASVVPVAPTTSLAVAGALLVAAVLIGAALGSLTRHRIGPPQPDLLPRETE